MERAKWLRSGEIEVEKVSEARAAARGENGQGAEDDEGDTVSNGRLRTDTPS